MKLIESRRYFQCAHCGTYQFPDTVEADGIRIVGQLADAPACPVCQVGMAHALLDDQPVDFCKKCRGVFMPRETFAGVIQKRRAWATEPPADPVPLDREALHRKLSCPKCKRRFDTYPHYGPGNAIIDNCTACDLIWLDFGEMRQIVNAPGSDRGSRHVPRVDEKYVREGAERATASEDEDRPKDPLAALLDLLLSG